MTAGMQLPSGEPVLEKRPIRRVLVLIPLIILMLISLVLAGIGVTTKLEAREVAAAQRQALLSSNEFSTEAPTICQAPSLVAGPTDIWAGSQAASSDNIYAEHPDALGMRVEGKNGFNFWGDAQSSNFSQALGRGPWLDEQLAAWLAYFKELDQELDGQGRNLVIAISPANWQLYRENLPAWTSELQGSTHLDQLLERSGDLPLVDVRESMLVAKETAPVYSAVNSHWTPYGANAAWAQIVNCATSLYPSSVWAGVSIPEMSGFESTLAPNEFADFGDTSAPQDWTIPKYRSALHAFSTEITDASGEIVAGGEGANIGVLEMPAATTNPQGSGTALILRDSTGDALSQLWGQSFARTCQIRHNLDYPTDRPDALGEAERCDADTVLYVFTERYFAQPPPVM